jgi:hypothetical protein
MKKQGPTCPGRKRLDRFRRPMRGSRHSPRLRRRLGLTRSGRRPRRTDIQRLGHCTTYEAERRRSHTAPWFGFVKSRIHWRCRNPGVSRTLKRFRAGADSFALAPHWKTNFSGMRCVSLRPSVTPLGPSRPEGRDRDHDRDGDDMHGEVEQRHVERVEELQQAGSNGGDAKTADRGDAYGC